MGIAQIPKGNFTTKIDKAKTVYAKGAANIAQAQIVNIYPNKIDTLYLRDTIYIETKPTTNKVAEVVIDRSKPDSKLYVVGANQTKDALGIYRTVIEFGNVGGGMITGVEISIRFNTVFESYNWSGISLGMNILEGHYDDKMGVFYKAGMLQSDETIKLIVTSKKQLFATILGATGTYN